jgi:hypothetical protein
MVVAALAGCVEVPVVVPDDLESHRLSPARHRLSHEVPPDVSRRAVRPPVGPGTPANPVEGVVRVYQDEDPWWNAGRAYATLISIGKVEDEDYFAYELNQLREGIPEDTDLVVITSNSLGEPEQALRQSHPAAQAALQDFLVRGGTVIIDMGDNLPSGGFIAPGATGTPNLVFPEPCHEGRFTVAGQGHPLRTAFNTLDESDISTDPAWCNVAHGNLEQGITLPADARALVTATFGGVPRVVLAEYCYEGGRVILDTMAKEWNGFAPVGTGPSRFMQNLFAYGLSQESACDQEPPPAPIGVPIRNVFSGPPARNPGIVNVRDDHMFVEILDVEQYLGRVASASDVRVGPSFGQGVPAQQFQILDIDNDGKRDIRLRFPMETLVASGRLDLVTDRVEIWGRDPADNRRFRGDFPVQVVWGSAAVDQNQPRAPSSIADFSQTGLAQSFQTQQQVRPTIGAGVFLSPDVGSSDLVRIQLWDRLPNAGGSLLAEGEAMGTAGQWVDVLWPPVLLAPNTTYYLVFSGNTTLGIRGDPAGPYPHGHLFANPGFQPFTFFDFTFRTWIQVETGGMTPDQARRMRTSPPHGTSFRRGECPATAPAGRC